MEFRHALAGAGALLLAATAQAAPITYTFSGIASGTVGGVPFTNQAYTFTVTGDTEAVIRTSSTYIDTSPDQTYPGPSADTAALLGPPPMPAPYDYFNPLTGGTVRIANTTCASGCAISSPGSYFVTDMTPSLVRGIKMTSDPEANDFLFEGCFSILCGGSGSFSRHNLATGRGSETTGDEGAYEPYQAFATAGGVVQLSGVPGNHITYWAYTATNPIPTLSQWGVILMSGLLGLAALRNIRRWRP